MRATIKNYIDAMQQRREELGEENDKGFSLIELIIVVVILGILAAIAIPIFLNISDQAKQSAVDAAAGNAASQWAAQIAKGTASPSLTNITNEGFTVVPTPSTNIDSFCIVLTKDGKTGFAGPGCTGSPTASS